MRDRTGFGHQGRTPRRRSLVTFLSLIVLCAVTIGQSGTMAFATAPSAPGSAPDALQGRVAGSAPRVGAVLISNADADLQGWRPAPVSGWTQGNVCGAVPSGSCYSELDNVPHKIAFTGLTPGTTYYAEVLNEYQDGASGPLGYKDLNRNLLPGFNDANASGVSLAFVTNVTCGSKICGKYHLEWTATAASGEVQFNALLALGAHLWSGSNLSVQLNGSNETVTIPVNEIVVPITAHKFNDLNGNGTQDAGEPDLANWEMTLYKADCSTKVTNVGSGVNPALTAADGNYTWHVLGSTGTNGEWCVKETLQTGWTNTTGNLAGVKTTGGTVTFGNKQLQPNLQIVKTADASHVTAGEQVGFTITVTNNGQGAAKGVVMTDTLPGGLTWSFNQVQGNWTCGINSGVLTCGGQNFDLASGASASVHIEATTARADCGQVQNKASVSASNNPTVQSNTATVIVDCPNLSIQKTADATPVNAGEPIGYTITVTNGGPGVAKDVVMTDALPTNGGLSWSVAGTSGGWTCAISTGTLTCGGAGFNLGVGSSATVHITSPTTRATCGTVNNTASVTGSNTNTDSDGPVSISVRCPNLTINKTADATPVNAGEDIGYTITVTNTGAGTAKDVTLTDTLPANAGLSWSISPAVQGCSISNGALSCFFGSLATGDSRSVHIVSPTTAASCGQVLNVASVSGSNNPTATSNQVAIDVRCAAIVITKVADANTVSAGDMIGFTITVTNTGAGTAKGVTVTDTLPTNAGLSWSISPVAQGCSISNGELSCSFGDLTSNQSRSVHIVSPTTADSCGSVVNTASVTTTNDGSGTATASITVNCPDVTLAKDEDAATVDAGDPIGFTITVSNAGLGNAYGATVTDNLPAGGSLDWTIDAVDGQAPGPQSPCSITAGVLTCSFGSMAPGASHTVHITSDTDYRDCAQIDNTAVVTITNGDGANDGASVTVNCPDLGIQIVKDGPDTVHVGDTITYTFDVSLTTPEPLFDVAVADDRCDEGAPILVSRNGGDQDDVLEPNEVWNYTCTHVVVSSDPSLIPNTATVTGSSDDGRNATDSDDHEVTVIHPAIQIVKTVNDDTGVPGETVTYTFVVTNTGDTTLYDISVDDDVIGHIGDIASLDAGDSETLTVDYVLPEKNIDSVIVNVGTAKGHDSLDGSVKDDDDAQVTVVIAKNPPAPPKGTAFTGSNALRFGTIALILLGLGLAALALGRRRRTGQA